MPYRPGGKRSDNPYVNFYWDYYSQGKPCYVKMDYPPLEEIVAVIHRNHGAAVIAHPGVNLKGNTITCGSDFHGKAKPSVSLGQHACPIPDVEIVSKIKFPPQASGRL